MRIPDPACAQLRDDSLNLEHCDWIDPAKGSSSKINAGLMARLAGDLTRRLSPPDSENALFFAMCVIPNSSSSWRVAPLPLRQRQVHRLEHRQQVLLTLSLRKTEASAAGS